jgi:hypothetical protein
MYVISVEDGGGMDGEKRKGEEPVPVVTDADGQKIGVFEEEGRINMKRDIKVTNLRLVTGKKA